MRKKTEEHSMKDIKALFEKYREAVMYLFFGGCTTLVNFAVYWLCTRPVHMGEVAATAVAWVLSVLFAYVTNRKWVFESQAKGAKAITGEMVNFFAGRAATGVMDVAIMFVSVTMLGLPDMVMKILSNVLVIILNYFISKLIVFREK